MAVFRQVIVLFFIFLFSGCLATPNLDTKNQNNFSQQPYNYLVIQTANLPDFITNPSQLVTNIFQQISHSDYLLPINSASQSSSTYHFFWTNPATAHPSFYYFQPIDNHFSLPDFCSTANTFTCQTKNNFFVITNQLDSPLPTLAEPPSNSFLSIYSLHLELPPANIIPEYDQSNLILINTINNIVSQQPLHFYWVNNQILVNQYQYQKPLPENKMSIFSNLDWNNPTISQTILLDRLNIFLSQTYLDSSLVPSKQLSSVLYQSDQDHYSLTLQLDENSTSTFNCFNIANHLQQTKSYYPQTKTLTDYTTALLTSPGVTPLALTTDQNQFSFPNFQQQDTYLSCQTNKIQITNYQPWIDNTNISSLIIPWNNLKTIFPNLPSQLDFIKSFQLNFTQNNYFGLVVK